MYCILVSSTLTRLLNYIYIKYVFPQIVALRNVWRVAISRSVVVSKRAGDEDTAIVWLCGYDFFLNLSPDNGLESDSNFIP